MFSGKIVPFKLSDRGIIVARAAAGGDKARYVTRGQQHYHPEQVTCHNQLPEHLSHNNAGRFSQMSSHRSM